MGTTLLNNGKFSQMPSVNSFEKLSLKNYLKNFDSHKMKILYNNTEIINMRNTLDIPLIMRQSDNRFDEEYTQLEREYNRLSSNTRKTFYKN